MFLLDIFLFIYSDGPQLTAVGNCQKSIFEKIIKKSHSKQKYIYISTITLPYLEEL